MPRKSAAALAAPVIDVSRIRVEPPSTLTGPARAIFCAVVDSVDPSHFRACDVPAIEAFAEAISLARTAAAQIATQGAVADGRASPWVGILERAHRSVAGLGRALRLTPHARHDRKVAGTTTRTPARGSIAALLEIESD